MTRAQVLRDARQRDMERTMNRQARAKFLSGLASLDNAQRTKKHVAPGGVVDTNHVIPDADNAEVEAKINADFNAEQTANVMSCKAIMERVTAAAAATSKVSAATEKLSEFCNSVLKKDANKDYPVCMPGEVREQFADFFDDILAGVQDLYDAYDGPISMETSDWKASQKDFPSDKGERDFGVRAFVSDGCLFIKTPPLPHSINPQRRLKNSGQLYRFSHLFTRELYTKLCAISDEIPALKKKTISYFFVRPEGFSWAIDCDNVDAKAITDVICMFFLSGDSALTTSFTLDTIFDNRLPTGTYIRVAEGQFVAANFAQILEKFSHQPA